METSINHKIELLVLLLTCFLGGNLNLKKTKKKKTVKLAFTDLIDLYLYIYGIFPIHD